MKVFTLEAKQQLPISIEEAWEFLANPRNLSKITPEYMNFYITSFVPDAIYPGMIITYNVCPIPNVPMTWVTEITQVKELSHFVDEQRFGPYRMWHHQHFLKEIDGGVELNDLIHYVMPFGFLGNIARSMFVQKQLNGIFDYRFKVLENLFGTL
jgi:ligand-binding SRPBCC domain-containing protein